MSEVMEIFFYYLHTAVQYSFDLIRFTYLSKYVLMNKLTEKQNAMNTLFYCVYRSVN